MPLQLKPLASRPGDIAAITAAFLLRHQNSAAMMSGFAWPTAQAMQCLLAHSWPGNARELGNMLQRAIVLREGEGIEASDLNLQAPAAISPIAAAVAKPRATTATLQDVTRASKVDAIRAALRDTGGHRAHAAAMLGISERTLRYRLAEMRDMAMAG
jgi:two-component system response regulator FlrC